MAIPFPSFSRNSLENLVKTNQDDWNLQWATPPNTCFLGRGLGQIQRFSLCCLKAKAEGDKTGGSTVPVGSFRRTSGKRRGCPGKTFYLEGCAVGFEALGRYLSFNPCGACRPNLRTSPGPGPTAPRRTGPPPSRSSCPGSRAWQRPHRRQQQIFEVPQDVRANGTVFVARQRELLRLSLAFENIEVVKPEIGEHFFQLPVGVDHLAVKFGLAQVLENYLPPNSGGPHAIAASPGNPPERPVKSKSHLFALPRIE